MHKTKMTLTPNKTKTKTVSPSPTPKKVTKSRDRVTPHSPRNNRIHTLDTKPSPAIPKKNRNGS